MFNEYYGLSSDPFRLSPDTRFCYRHPNFARVQAAVNDALRADPGLVVITGSPGIGKTTLVNDLLFGDGTNGYTVAVLVNTPTETDALLRSAAFEFGLEVTGKERQVILDELRRHFEAAHAAARPPVLIIDEAQNLSERSLAELQLLVDLHDRGTALLQIFLVGQHALDQRLRDPSLARLRRCVSAAATLPPLEAGQLAEYITHRLKVVGWQGRPSLAPSMLPLIEAACQGVPRRINQVCSRLMLHGAIEQKAVLDAADARLILAELQEERLSGPLEEHVPARPAAARRRAAGSDMDLQDYPDEC
jgi:type II secretory pathway predicted ATPase ExeA